MLVKVSVCYNHGLTPHYCYHFLKAICHQSTSGAYNIANCISQSDARCNLDAAAYLLYFSGQFVAFKIICKKPGITCRYLFIIEEFNSCKGGFLWDGEAQVAMCKAELLRISTSLFFSNTMFSPRMPMSATCCSTYCGISYHPEEEDLNGKFTALVSGHQPRLKI